MANSVWNCLDLGLYDGAEMLAEQLVASDPGSADAAFLYGLVLLRQSLPLAAKHAVSGHCRSHAGCIYITAQAIYSTQNWTEGIDYLTATQHIWSNTPSRRGVSSAAVFLLLGKFRRQNDPSGTATARCLAMSTKLNPYLWENVALLTSMRGINVRTDNLFTRFDDPLNMSTRDFDVSSSTPVLPMTSTPRRVYSTPRTVSFGGIGFGPVSTPRRVETPMVHSHPPVSAISTPGPPQSGTNDADNVSDGIGMAGVETPKQPGHHINSSSFGLMPPPPPLQRRRRDRPASLSFRRSISNTFGPVDNSSSMIGGLGIGGIATATSSGHNEVSKNAETSTNHMPQILTEAHDSEISVFERFARILKLMSRCSFKNATAELNKLPLAHQHSPTAISLRATCYMETCAFEDACECYRELRSRQPGRVKDMDFYSTTLWHLRLDHELGMLAHDLVTQNRTSPESWCALGNAFSLLQQPSKAVDCFDRAIQLAPGRAYAYALQGHEFYANDDFQDAEEAFRKALEIDPFNHNVWYGLGSVLLSLGYVESAEAHYEQALKLNPENAMLVCFLGMVLEVRGEYRQALAQYTRAVEMQPRSASARFKRAEALLDAHFFADALHELKILEQQTPTEASVFMAMGDAYNGLGDIKAAMHSFAIAQDLDPKMVNPLADSAPCGLASGNLGGAAGNPMTMGAS